MATLLSSLLDVAEREEPTTPRSQRTPMQREELTTPRSGRTPTRRNEPATPRSQRASTQREEARRASSEQPWAALVGEDQFRSLVAEPDPANPSNLSPRTMRGVLPAAERGSTEVMLKGSCSLR